MAELRTSGFDPKTKTFRSLRPRVALPPQTEPLSVSEYAFTLLHSSPATSPSPATPFLIDSTSGHVITYPDFIRRTKSLASSLPSLSKNDVALVLSPPSLDVPVLYFSLLSLGVTVCPVNPLTTPSELTHMIRVAKPVVAFTTSHLSPKIPNLAFPTVLLDSPEFKAMMSSSPDPTRKVKVEQSDRAAILFSSGTTGRVKGVDLTHRNFIALLTGFYHVRGKGEVDEPRAVWLIMLPLFHVFGFTRVLWAAAVGETLVIMTSRVEFKGMLEAVERYKVSYMPVPPPVVVALAKSPVVAKYDISTLSTIMCGGAPLGKEVMEALVARFHRVKIKQGYGLTETVGAATRMLEPEETTHYGSVGKLSENLEAKIIDPTTGEALPPSQRGELWLRGPTVMRGLTPDANRTILVLVLNASLGEFSIGFSLLSKISSYVGDEGATAATLDQDGWLKTGDLCYFDSDGFIYVVDRLKELIKYKAYQVPPAELEQLLHGHPEIADAAVVPYPDEEAGQIPMAFIVRKPHSNITATQVMEFIAKQVSPYKKIRRVAFINVIPKSSAGKILRRELASYALSGASSKL